jgi:hypothetical protein
LALRSLSTSERVWRLPSRSGLSANSPDEHSSGAKPSISGRGGLPALPTLPTLPTPCLDFYVVGPQY